MHALKSRAAALDSHRFVAQCNLPGHIFPLQGLPPGADIQTVQRSQE